MRNYRDQRYLFAVFAVFLAKLIHHLPEHLVVVFGGSVAEVLLCHVLTLASTRFVVVVFGRNTCAGEGRLGV